MAAGVGLLGLAGATTVALGLELQKSEQGSLLTPTPTVDARTAALRQEIARRPLIHDPKLRPDMSSARDIQRVFDLLMQRAIDARDPVVWLAQIHQLHEAWHAGDPTERGMGFFTFHWHLMTQFRALGLDRLMQVPRATAADFSTGGYYGSFLQQPWDSSFATDPVHSLSDLTNLAGIAESWHNQAHLSLDGPTPPRVPGFNDFFNHQIMYAPTFWTVHGLLNDLFEAQLRALAESGPDRFGATAGVPEAMVALIEQRQQRWVSYV